ncbi:hypothetical protein [Methylotenera sp.]|uniref:hypothetical protein n=1 Tax=Methylotenera sp. TaxID=2051956 RepID=UPI002EDA0521
MVVLHKNSLRNRRASVRGTDGGNNTAAYILLGLGAVALLYSFMGSRTTYGTTQQQIPPGQSYGGVTNNTGQLITAIFSAAGQLLGTLNQAGVFTPANNNSNAPHETEHSNSDIM